MDDLFRSKSAPSQPIEKSRKRAPGAYQASNAAPARDPVFRLRGGRLAGRRQTLDKDCLGRARPLAVPDERHLQIHLCRRMSSTQRRRIRPGTPPRTVQIPKKTEPQLAVTVVSSAHAFRCVLSDAGGQRRTRFRGTRKRSWMFTLAATQPCAPGGAYWYYIITISGACPRTAVRRNLGMVELRQLRFPPKHTPRRVCLTGKHARFRSSAAAC